MTDYTLGIDMTEGDWGPFSPYDFMRQDESNDRLFYLLPRLVVHIDDQAIAAVGELFKEVLYSSSTAEFLEDPPGVSGEKAILDLMSSWRSHWPLSHPENLDQRVEGPESPEAPTASYPKKMIGLGLNGVEMGDNPDLDDYVVHDVNKEPRLPFDEGSFDGVVITVSIQYLTRPIQVFREVNRVLKPGGAFLVIFSNRMFFTKAVSIWTGNNDQQRMDLVASYFRHAGNFEDISGVCRNPHRGPLDDPVYVVMARKPASGLTGELSSEP